MAYLVIKNGPDRGRSYEIQDQPVTAGRDRSQTIQILDAGVSRTHAEIFRLGDLFVVRDLGSTNGTYVNGRKIQEEVISYMDEIVIGNTVLVLSESPELPEEQAPEADAASEKPPIEGSTIELKEPPPQAERGVESELFQQESRTLNLSHEIFSLLAREPTEEKGITAALNHLVRCLDAGQGFCLEIDPATKAIRKRVEAAHGREAGLSPKISRAIVNHVVQSGRATLTRDAMVDERFQFSESIVFREIRSVICVPLLRAGRVTRVLYLHRSEEPLFTIRDLELCSHAGLQMSLYLEASRFEDTLQRNMDRTIRALLQAVDGLLPQAGGHALRVADLARALAMELGLSRAEAGRIRLAAYLHDVGKLVVAGGSDAADQDLSDERHVYEGEKIVTSIPGGEELLPGVKYHHERADGSGYPYGIKNDETPTMAKILIVANAFDNACRYAGGKPGRAPEEALREIQEQGGRAFDADVVQALVRCSEEGRLLQVPPSDPA